MVFTSKCIFTLPCHPHQQDFVLYGGRQTPNRYAGFLWKAPGSKWPGSTLAKPSCPSAPTCRTRSVRMRLYAGPSSGSLATRRSTPPRSWAVLHLIQMSLKEWCSIKKTQLVQLATQPHKGFLSRQPSYSGMQRMCFMLTFHFVTQNTESTCTQDLRYNKVNFFLLNSIFEWIWNFYCADLSLVCHCIESC